jgi:hypothetical protein
VSGIEVWAREAARNTVGDDEFRSLVENYWNAVIGELRLGIDAYNGVSGKSVIYKIVLEEDELVGDQRLELRQGKTVVEAVLTTSNKINFVELRHSKDKDTTAEPVEFENLLPIRTSSNEWRVAAFNKAGECSPEDVARYILKTLLHI